jgi:putative YpdA family bacillithiol system oxidoreductase
MESSIIWLSALLLFFIIFIPYFFKFRRSQKMNLERQKEARELGIDKPTSQYPFIDQVKCIGCGSCILACPEGDVLGIVHGKAAVINGLRCVGHGLCEPACPVSAIKVGLGDIKKRDDIPVMDEYNQTNVDGIYIAGELGGLSLIKNAIEQGRKTVERIAELKKDSGHPDIYDVVIVGAGPAGLSAALTAEQNKLYYRVFDRQELGGTILQYPRQKLVMTQPVSIPMFGDIEKTELSKEQLLEIWEAALSKNKISVSCNFQVNKVQKENGVFNIYTSEGQFKSKAVVLAMGRRGTPRKLNIPGEDLPKVAYQLVDARSYQDKNILVIGGGDSAVEAAVGLSRQKGNQVTVSYRKEKFFRIKKKNEERILQLIKKKKIHPLFNSNPVKITEKSVILKKDDKTMEIPNDYVFIFIGGIPPFQMLREMGIRFGSDSDIADSAESSS